MITIVPSVKKSFLESKIEEKRVILNNLTWESYQQILHALPQNRTSHLTYDRGILEITMPLETHEWASELIGLFIRILAVEMGLKLKSMRSTTINRQDLDRGAEPDCAYYIQNQSKVAGKTIDFTQDPPPDLVVEVDITHSDIDKNRLYASMGVPEFWRYNGQELKIYKLEQNIYLECDRSPTFDWIDKEYLYRFLEDARADEVEAEVRFRAYVKQVLNGRSPS
jgi:Uma2 family endonuclease